MPTPPQPLQSFPKASEIKSIIDRAISELAECQNAIARNITPATANFDNVVLPPVQIDDKLQSDIAMVSCLGYASPDKEIRNITRQQLKKYSDASDERLLDDKFFQLLKAVEAKAEPLDPECEKLLKDSLHEYTITGRGSLPPEQVDEYTRRRAQIDELRRDFNENLRSNSEGVWYDQYKLAGLEHHQIISFQAGTEPSNVGKRFITFKSPDTAMVSKFAANPSTRRDIYLASNQKLAQNVPLFSRIMQLRDTNARLLGYQNHAAFRLETRMAKTPEWVGRFLGSLQQGLAPLAKQDVEHLHSLKRAHLASHPAEAALDDPESFFPWDLHYYKRIAQEKIGIDMKKVSEFFPLEYTVSAMLRLFTSCLGIVFIPVPREELVGHIYHEDIQVFSVWEGEDSLDPGSFVGYLYTDLLWREGKIRGNQDVNLQRGYEKPDGSRVYPATMLMCAFSPSTVSSKCPLLSHSEVVTLFHELGHGIHDLLSRTKHTRFHSYNGARDFGEAPSVFLENFCWLKDELREMSCHYSHLSPEYLAEWQENNPDTPQPPEKIPDEVLNSLVASRSLNLAWWCADQLACAIFDLKIHSPQSHQDLLDLDITKRYNDLTEDLTHIRAPEGTDRGHPHVHFGHLVAGYDVNYYSYPWGWVFAADVFETFFAKNPRDRAAWERYRRMILEPGGSRDEKKLVEEFLGRPLRTDAYLRSLGVTGKT